MKKNTDDEGKNRYQWQEECLKLWEQNGYRGIVSAVTGAGKTHFAIKAIKKLGQMYGENLWIAIVVPTRALMAQWNQILRTSLLEQDGFENASYQVYVVNSARYQLARRILTGLREGTNVLLIADECHHYASKENRKIFEFFPYAEEASGRYCSLGLSATIKNKGSEEMEEPALGKVIFRYSYERALQDGVISEFLLYQIAVGFRPDEHENYQALSEQMRVIRRQLYARYPLLGINGNAFFSMLQALAKKENTANGRLANSFLYLSYQRKKLVCMAKNRIFCVCDLMRNLDVRKKVIIFSEHIEQADALYEMLKSEYDGKIGKYHSKAGKQANENAVERFRNGEIFILITCKALDEGIDVPDAETGIILSGTGVERQRMQRLGRILRKSDKKKMARLYYLFIKESSEEKSYFPLRGEYFQVIDDSYSGEE